MTDLEQLLRHELERAATRIHLTPGLAERAYRNRRRKQLAARAATATAAVAAAATGIAATAALSQSGQTAGPAPAAYVIGHSETALDAVVSEDPVISVFSPDFAQGVGWGNSGGPAAMWAQTRQWYHDDQYRMEGLTAAGQPVYDFATSRNAETNVLYAAKAWWVDQFAGGAQSTTSTPACSDRDIKYFGADGDPRQWATDINEALHCGFYTTGGTQQVDGVAAIKLVPVNPDHLTAVLWLDPSTYLPVKIAVESVTGGQTQPQHTEYVNWLPPTSANLASLNAAPPAGFTRIPDEPAVNCAQGDSACFTQALKQIDAWYQKYLAPRLPQGTQHGVSSGTRQTPAAPLASSPVR
jgi:hypothetical protein